MSSLPSPDLDDRDFRSLLEEAHRYVRTNSPDWTDLSPGDPGVVLLEVFAYLTEALLYRLNQVPQKVFVEFLRLMGVRLEAPAGASVSLSFSLSRPSGERLVIPRGTRVTTDRRSGGGADGPVFATLAEAVIDSGASEIAVGARHLDLVDAELVGTGTGAPGLTVTVARPPIVLPIGDDDLIVGVETDAAALEQGDPARQFGGRAYRVWREVDSFTTAGADRFVYVVDRTAGRIIFAPAVRMPARAVATEAITATAGDVAAEPDAGVTSVEPAATAGAESAEPDAGAAPSEPTTATGTVTGRESLAVVPRALAEVPPAGREIRVWYGRGGGAGGNVSAGSLTVLKDPLRGVEVTNPGPAMGGRDGESVDNAVLRGPQELHSPLRAVTASDFEQIAVRSSGAVARAAALTRAEVWAHGLPGTVEVLLVPHVGDAGAPDRVSAVALDAHETDDARDRVAAAIDSLTPLGITSAVEWAHYKSVWVDVEIVVHRSEDADAVRARVEQRLHQVVNPLPNGASTRGWPFGQALRASHIYEIVLREPGVRYVDALTLHVDEAPDAGVEALEPDASQARTWYAASGARLFRSLNDGEGWEVTGRFDGETVEVVRSHPQRPGLVAVASRPEGQEATRLRLSHDCGETWEPGAALEYHVEDAAWIVRDGAPVLLVATDRGLYQLPVGGSPVQLLVDPNDQQRAFYAVAAVTDVRGGSTIAVASQREGGVFVSTDGAQSFTLSGLAGEDVRLFGVQTEGSRRYLWAGTAAEGGTASGCFRWEVGTAEPWRQYGQNWIGGSCFDLAFAGSTVFAGTYETGVLRLDSAAREPAWRPPTVTSRLPLRPDTGRFQPARAVGTTATGAQLLVGGPAGVHRSADGGETYQPASEPVFRDKVTIPPSWLVCSANHQVRVVTEGATR